MSLIQVGSVHQQAPEICSVAVNLWQRLCDALERIECAVFAGPTAVPLCGLNQQGAAWLTGFAKE